MDKILLILALPLFVLALLSIPHRRPKTAPLGHGGLEARAPATRGRWSAWELMSSRFLAWSIFVAFLVGIVLAVHAIAGGPNYLRLLLLCRYGILGGLLLVGLVPLSLLAVPSLLGNLFVLRRPGQLFHLAWIAYLVGTMAVVTARVVELNAPARFGTKLLTYPAWVSSIDSILTVLVLSLPVPYAALLCTRAAQPTATTFPLGKWLVSGLLGVLMGVGLIVLAAAMQKAVLSERVTDPKLFPLQSVGEWVWERADRPRWDGLYATGDRLASAFGYFEDKDAQGNHQPSGYTKPNDDGSYHLAPGHSQLLVGMGIVVLVYLVSYVLVLLRGTVPGPRSLFSSLFLVLLVLLFIGFFLQGLAFALDFYRVPVTVVVGLFSYFLYQVTRTDHFFDLNPRRSQPPTQPGSNQLPDLSDVVRQWKIPPVSKGPAQHPDRKTLVVVTASGGGIQATAWACRVLVGLQERYGDSFTRSIGLLSAVSGGSVGALYYLDRWRSTGSPLQPADWSYPPNGLPGPDTICGRAMTSSLEATAWGIAFPDLMGILFPPFVSRTDDRGDCIETAWRSRLDHPDARLNDWTNAIRRGEMPIPVFNATIVETGQRFLASPVRGRRRPGPPPAFQARELFELYPDAEPRLSTVARLSATFPFVSPICRPVWDKTKGWPENHAYHYADGGYIDNEGMMTAIEWLYDLLDPAYLSVEDRQRAFDQILFVRLMPFPAATHAPDAELKKGWIYSTIGPIEALQNIRTASQQERNELAVSIFSEVAEKRGVRVGAAPFYFRSAAGSDPPLSWMLTEPQQQEIDRAWQSIVADEGVPGSPLAIIRAFF